METIYRCDACGLRVREGEGYIHSTGLTTWAIHHRECAPDLTHEVCYGVPRHWADLLTATYWMRQQHKQAVTQ